MIDNKPPIKHMSVEGQYPMRQLPFIKQFVGMVHLVEWLCFCWFSGYVCYRWLDYTNHGRISSWLESHALYINSYYIIWSCETALQPLSIICSRYRRLFRGFFSLGVWFGLVACIFMCTILLVDSILLCILVVIYLVKHGLTGNHPSELTHSSTFTLSKFSIDLLVNTVKRLSSWMKENNGTLPIGWPSGLGCLVLTLSIHELGHAAAALTEGLWIRRMGIFSFFFLPGMFVTLDEDLEELPRKSRLRVICAGFWFNMMLCFVCLVILHCLPLLVFPLFTRGLVVSETSSKDTLLSKMEIGDRLLMLNNIRVNNIDQLKAVNDLKTSIGLCVNKEKLMQSPFYRPFDECCPGFVEKDKRNVSWSCFVDIVSNNQGEPNALCIFNEWISNQSISLGECQQTTEERVQFLVPYTERGRHLVCLTVLKAKDGTIEEMVLVIESILSIQWSEFIPKISWPYSLYQYVVKWQPIDQLDRILRLLILFSATIGISNMAPLWKMDGQVGFSLLMMELLGIERHCFVIRKQQFIILLCSSLLIIDILLLLLFIL